MVIFLDLGSAAVGDGREQTRTCVDIRLCPLRRQCRLEVLRDHRLPAPCVVGSARRCFIDQTVPRRPVRICLNHVIRVVQDLHGAARLVVFEPQPHSTIILPTYLIPREVIFPPRRIYPVRCSVVPQRCQTIERNRNAVSRYPRLRRSGRVRLLDLHVL